MVNKLNIGYIISSNNLFFPHTYPKLHQSLLNCGIETENILWFVGGGNLSNSNENIYYLDHNSFDLTAIIGLLDNNIDNFSHIFLLHDTCEAGSSFKQRVENFDAKEDHVSICGFMTMGMFNLNMLKREKQHLLSLKNMSKKTAGLYEVYFYERYGKKSYKNMCGAKEDYQSEKRKDVYSQGYTRRVCYFDYIDLYKYPRAHGLESHIQSL